VNFIETFYENINNNPAEPFVTEMHGAQPVPTTGRSLANMIAAARGTLRSHGVEPGDRVVLLGPNSARWVALDVAILAEGAITVPMYARQDPSELTWMMQHAEPKAILVSDEELARSIYAAWDDAPQPPLVLFDDVMAGEPVHESPAPREQSDVATIIYTSGTSGEPKGVMTTVANVDYMLPVVRDALVRLMGPRKNTGSGDAKDRVFHYLPFCFTGSRLVLWTCLYRANGIIVSTDLDQLKTEFTAAKPHYFLNVPTLLERIKNGVEEKIEGQGKVARSLYEAARGAWERQVGGHGRPGDALVLALAQRVLFKKIRQGIGPNLECLICGSAPLGEDTQRWFEMLGIPVYQVYGLSETTGIVTMDEPRQAVAGRVGRVIPGCEATLSDEGELLVRGPNVFPGYWKRPDLTEQSFQDGWYRTGDRAEVDETGNWKILGRVKNLLVPSSGHNIAPEPIEQKILERTPGIEHAVLMGHGRPYLTALITGTASREQVQQVLDAVNEELPHYKRVRAFHLASESLTPENGLLTANQKLKRGAIETHFKRELDALYGRAQQGGASARSRV
jgi:long-chain acyl-CoA synthetase